MAIKCPKCQTSNPDTLKFCGECGTQLLPSKEIHVTETLETPKEELTRGTTFAQRYEIIEELGKGGMGKVYRVEDTKTKEELALKLIKPEISADKKTIERFNNEIKLAHKISHRNVCRMYHLGEEKGTYFITMEYVHGEDLKSFIIRAAPLSTARTITIAKQICEGLIEAHSLRIVHRDLKPSNIMIDKEGNARIMDFGIARSLKEKGITGAGVMIGTPEYMSPEQVEGKEVDQRSDIYSLGVILYEMVTGRVPFEGDSPFTIGMKHKGEIPKDPKEINAQIPEDLSRVVLRCLEKNKEKRYQSAGEVRSELVNIEKGIPTTERAVPERKPFTSKEITVTFGLKKLFIPALIVIAFVIIAVAIWQLLPKKESPILPEEKQSIAVISFENQTGDNTYDHLRKIIPNLLITSLEQSGYFQVATWERMHDLLKQLGKDKVEFIDRDLGFELCRMEGIKAIVLGSFGKAGDMFATDLKVLDVESKSLLKSASSKGKGVDSILESQIDELSKEISQGTDIAKRKEETAQVRIADVTTNSMDAYYYYLRGREANEKLYYEEARQFLEKAVELDPTFASAYLELASSYNWLGNTNAMNEAYEKAKAFSQKATDKERLLIEALYAFFKEKNAEKGFRFLTQLAKDYPKEKRVHFALGVYYQMVSKSFDKAIEEYNKALELDPNYGDIFNMLAYTYIDMGNFEKAIENFEKYASLFPKDANPIDSMAELYFQMGELDEAIAKYKKALEVKSDFGSDWQIGYIYALKENYPEALKWNDLFVANAPSPGLKAEGLLWKGFYHYWMGSLDRSLINLRKAADLSYTVGNEELIAYTEWMNGWIYYNKGEVELGQRHYKIWFDFKIKDKPTYVPIYTADHNFFLGLADLKQGRIDLAKSRLAEIESLLPEISPAAKDRITFYRAFLSVEALLAEGSVEEAIATCKNASLLKLPSFNGRVDVLVYNLPFLKDVLAKAYQQKGDMNKAIAEYERVITFDPNSQERRLIHPVYHYRLAKLYEEKGNKNKSIEHYEKFLYLWKDADPGIAEVEDARERLAGLK